MATIRKYDDWRITICQNVTIKHKITTSEEIRIACQLDERRQAVDYMKEVARCFPDNFEYGVYAGRSKLKHTGGTP